MKKPKQWKHKKLGVYRSYYDFGTKSEDRIFVLVKGMHILSFESWQAAKKSGWVKV